MGVPDEQTACVTEGLQGSTGSCARTRESGKSTSSTLRYGRIFMVDIIQFGPGHEVHNPKQGDNSKLVRACYA